jgi:outer membrane protein
MIRNDTGWGGFNMRVTATYIKQTILCAALVVSHSLLAENTVTWEACLKEAGVKNPGIQSYQRSLEKSRATVAGSYSGFLPQLSASAGYSVSSSQLGSGSTVSPTTAATGSNGQYSGALTVSQNLFNGFADSAKLERNRASADSSRWALEGGEAQLRFDLKSAFARSLYYRQLTDLNQDVEKRRKENEDLVALRFEGGSENKGNYLRSKVSHSSAVVDLNQTIRNLEVARRNLALLMGRPDGESVGGTGELATLPLPSTTPDFSRLLKATPKHRQAEADRQVAEAGIRSSRSGFFPTLAVTGSVSRVGAILPPTTNLWSAGLTLTIPIFSGGSTYFDVEASVAERDRAEAYLSNNDLTVLNNLRQGYADYVSSVQRAEVQQQSVKAASLRAEIARAQYTNGLQTFVEWDLIENDLISQQQQMLSLMLQAVIAEASWEQAQGIGVNP